MEGLIAAIDAGGTKAAGALLGADGIVFRGERHTPGPAGAADPGSRELRALAAELAAAATERGEPVAAVGLGCCEYVADGRLTSAEVLAWTEQPSDWLPSVFPAASVLVESDVRAGLCAERALGLARGVDSVLYVSWGTGLSSALLLDGRIWAGAHGRAIALGELPTWGGSTVERFASGAGLAARWRSAGGPPDGDARMLSAAAAAGDPRATGIATSAGEALAEALRSAVHLIDPALIVLGGGLGSADTVARRAAFAGWQRLGSPVPLVGTALGPDGPLLGAALLAGWSGGPSSEPDEISTYTATALRKRSAVNR